MVIVLVQNIGGLDTSKVRPASSDCSAIGREAPTTSECIPHKVHRPPISLSLSDTIIPSLRQSGWHLSRPREMNETMPKVGHYVKVDHAGTEWSNAEVAWCSCPTV